MKVVGVLAEEAMLDPADVRMEASLEDLGIDLPGLIEAVFAIEEAFDIRVPFNANEPRRSAFDISTVERMVSAVEQLIAAQRPLTRSG